MRQIYTRLPDGVFGLGYNRYPILDGVVIGLDASSPDGQEVLINSDFSTVDFTDRHISKNVVAKDEIVIDDDVSVENSEDTDGGELDANLSVN